MNNYVQDVDFEKPINAIISENSIYVSYFNTHNLSYEIWVTEIFDNNVQTSFAGIYFIKIC